MMRIGVVCAALILAACGSTGPARAGTPTAALASPSSSSSIPPGITPPAGAAGSIEGHVRYPADALLAQAVYAVATDGGGYYYVETIGSGGPFLSGNPGAYRLIGVAPGDYFVLTALRDQRTLAASSARNAESRRFGAGYTKFVQCGGNVTCTDHTLVSVHVSIGTIVSDIDPGDWYFGHPNPLPIIPGAGPTGPNLGSPPAAFQESKQAAIYFAQLTTSARYVESSGACHVNLACVWFTAERDGHAAAYFTSMAGTNGIFRTCSFYFENTGGQWQFVDWNCRRAATAFPAVGSSGQLALGRGDGTGCINIRATPGLTTNVVACLPDGTDVTIDDGPYYLPEPTSSPDWGINYWWHIANRGWVAHRYVAFSP